MSTAVSKRTRTLPNRNRQHRLRPVSQPRRPVADIPQVEVLTHATQNVAYRPKSVAPRSTKPFPFFDLPGEIRNRIYDLVVPEARVIISGTHPQRDLEQMKKREPGRKHKLPRYQLKGKFTGNGTASPLLFACRQTNREALKYVYARTTFCFNSFVILRKFLNNIPEAARMSILSLEITHRGYGEPSLLADRKWKLRHDAKWAASLKQVKQQTALRRLVLDITNFDWPIQLQLRESWAKPLLELAGEGLDRVDLTLEQDSFPIERVAIVESELEKRMTTADGRRQKRQEGKFKAVEEQRRLEESKRKATKVLTISLPNGMPKASGPAKKVVKSKGLEQFAIAQPQVGYCG
ncbi:hypothetical protein H2200_010617 [Cladophialophora chaetospira]|uniref:DUF7730 domain-containing protein n=1 Tax=Cladophialophora chaetospira TaxID=386627 RepID=A0AA39CEI2_9EURO|nr:hypothetical protein H2200_010617 [Cladophialophora chaetospira]